jgi:hypothetical protein
MSILWGRLQSATPSNNVGSTKVMQTVCPTNRELSMIPVAIAIAHAIELVGDDRLE